MESYNLKELYDFAQSLYSCLDSYFLSHQSSLWSSSDFEKHLVCANGLLSLALDELKFALSSEVDVH